MVLNEGNMNLLIILAGFTGTLAMTLFTELASFILKKPFHVIRILSLMLHFGSNMTSKLKRDILYWIALVVHYAIGIFFSCVFDFFLEHDLMEFNLWNAMVFGSLAGLVGLLGWRFFFAIHPDPPSLILSQYLAIIWLGHLIFAMGAFLIYHKFHPNQAQAAISVY
jgi:hypothetical protein